MPKIYISKLKREIHLLRYLNDCVFLVEEYPYHRVTRVHDPILILRYFVSLSTMVFVVCDGNYMYFLLMYLTQILSLQIMTYIIHAMASTNLVGYNRHKRRFLLSFGILRYI